MRDNRKALTLTQGAGAKVESTAPAPAVGSARTAKSLDEWEPYPYEPTEDDEKLFASMAHVSPMTPGFLQAFARTGTIAEACRRIGISDSLPRKWRQRHSDFAELLEAQKDCVRDRWNATAQRKAQEGFEERLYNAAGELVGRKVREDASFLKAVLGSIDAEHWGRGGEGDQQINIIITRNEE